MDLDVDAILKVAERGGFALVVLVAFVWLVRTVGLAIVAEVKAQRHDMTAHHQLEVEHHTMVREDLAEIRGHLGIPTPVRGVPIQPMRSGTSNTGSQPILTVVSGSIPKDDK